MKVGKEKSVLLALAGVGFLIGVRMMLSGRKRYDLNGKVAIITGGSRGFGLVLARQLAAKGVKLVICSRTEEQLAAAKRELEAAGAEVLALRCDVTDRSQVKSLVESALNHYGRINILINNAGIIQVGPMNAMAQFEYQDAMNIHFWAPLYTTLAVLPHFRALHEGRIINIASIGGKIAVPHLLPYSASKFALVGLSEGLAAELKKENILVSTVVPSLMRTGSPRNITVKGNHEKEYALFKTISSLSIISKDPAKVAYKIVDALEYDKTRPTISSIERFASILKEIFPQGLETVFSLINRLLPLETPDGLTSKKGSDSESKLSANIIARGADTDAKMNNED
jgi:short-subunit dehydrogenase